MDLMAVNMAAGALEEATARPDHPLHDEAFLDALLGLIPCEGITLLELDVAHQRSDQLDLLAIGEEGDDEDRFWFHFWSSASCSYTERGGQLARMPCATTDFYTGAEWHDTGMYADVFRPYGVEWDLVLPLPGPPGISRRLVFFRGPGQPFADTEKAAARLLRPHLADALRGFQRAHAARSLTPRQQELLRLCAQGLDNTRIARALGISADTVRKHLENAFLRLDVTSRGQAVAALMPDLTWT